MIQQHYRRTCTDVKTTCDSNTTFCTMCIGEKYTFASNASAGLLEPRVSRLGLLKSAFIAENFICRLSWSIFSHFGAIYF